MYGNLYPALGEKKPDGGEHQSTLFFRQHVGEAKDEKAGITYELSFNMGGMHPIVHSSKTERYFTLSWHDIINLAPSK